MKTQVQVAIRHIGRQIESLGANVEQLAMFQIMMDVVIGRLNHLEEFKKDMLSDCIHLTLMVMSLTDKNNSLKAKVSRDSSVISELRNSLSEARFRADSAESKIVDMSIDKPSRDNHTVTRLQDDLAGARERGRQLSMECETVKEELTRANDLIQEYKKQAEDLITSNRHYEDQISECKARARKSSETQIQQRREIGELKNEVDGMKKELQSHRLDTVQTITLCEEASIIDGNQDASNMLFLFDNAEGHIFRFIASKPAIIDEITSKVVISHRQIAEILVWSSLGKRITGIKLYRRILNHQFGNSSLKQAKETCDKLYSDYLFFLG